MAMALSPCLSLSLAPACNILSTWDGCSVPGAISTQLVTIRTAPGFHPKGLLLGAGFKNASLSQGFYGRPRRRTEKGRKPTRGAFGLCSCCGLLGLDRAASSEELWTLSLENSHSGRSAQHP